MPAADLLEDAYGRVREVVRQVANGLSAEQLAVRVDAEANSVGWLLWHLTRVQDDHVADAAGAEQVWTSGGWAGRFALPYAPGDTGYGHSSDEVGRFRAVPAELLTGYHDAVHEGTVAYVRGLSEGDLQRVVDDAWDPPVTLAVRLVSVLGDDLQHAGQAAFVRGLLERR